MPKKPLMIPFSTRNGSLLPYVGYQYGSETDKIANNGRWEWKENFVFYDILKFQSFSRGCSSAKAVFKSQVNGKMYEMFLVDLSDLIERAPILHGVVEGFFTFSKRGQNYGVKLVHENDTLQTNDNQQTTTP